jgi:lipopolysaccharide transport system ATP-binding protein
MSDIAIRVEHLSKRYRIGQREQYKALRDIITDAVASPFRRLRLTGDGRRKTDAPSFVPRPPSPVPSPPSPVSGPQSPVPGPPSDNYIWALKDVSFEVKQGEVVGIIGRNGAGKSTLLKILSRITEPTEGRAVVSGRVGSLLEVGTGFHPELTGRENIYLNGAILGMRKSEIERNFDEIVAFAEVEKFIDTPVKHYSSGMYVRLAFAVAAHMDPEILLVDEVLAVGDAAFQKKCLGKMGDVAKGGRTVLFVSHNMGAINTLCTQAAYLVGGHIEKLGATNDVATAYMRDCAILSGTSDLVGAAVSRRGDGAALFIRARLQDLHGNPIACAQERVPFTIGLDLDVHSPIELRILSITLIDQFGNDLATTMHYDTLECPRIPAGVYGFMITFDPNPLRRGTFSVRLACLGLHFHEYDHVHHAFAFVVAPAVNDPDEAFPRPGVVNIDATWRMTRFADSC